jgi:transcriptional regulator with PAS, ATPase and Fis domain
MDRLVEELVARRIRLRQALQEFERKFISLVLKEQKGNCTRAARQLGIHRNTLLSKVQKVR